MTEQLQPIKTILIEQSGKIRVISAETQELAEEEALNVMKRK